MCMVLGVWPDWVEVALLSWSRCHWCKQETPNLPPPNSRLHSCWLLTIFHRFKVLLQQLLHGMEFPNYPRSWIICLFHFWRTIPSAHFADGQICRVFPNMEWLFCRSSDISCGLSGLGGGNFSCLACFSHWDSDWGKPTWSSMVGILLPACFIVWVSKLKHSGIEDCACFKWIVYSGL